MELDPEFTFIPLETKNCRCINDKKTQEFLEKWGVKNNISIQQFSFNEPFQPYHKYQLCESFFKNENVAHILKVRRGDYWVSSGMKADSVEMKQVPCTVKSMAFFDKLKDPKNKIVYNEFGRLCKRYDTDIEGFLVSDNLRGMLLDEECEEYNVYQQEERNELIFRIFQMLVLGGQLCQYEDDLQPYLDVTKYIYKDLVRVKREEDNKMVITSIVMDVVAKTSDGMSYYPLKSVEKQNIAFLCIDQASRTITTFLHQFNGY